MRNLAKAIDGAKVMCDGRRVSVTTAPVPAAAAPRRRPRGGQLLHGNRARTIGLVVALGVLFLVVVASLAIGARPIAFDRVVDALTDRDDSAATPT